MAGVRPSAFSLSLSRASSRSTDRRARRRSSGSGGPSASCSEPRPRRSGGRSDFRAARVRPSGFRRGLGVPPAGTPVRAASHFLHVAGGTGLQSQRAATVTDQFGPVPLAADALELLDQVLLLTRPRVRVRMGAGAARAGVGAAGRARRNVTRGGPWKIAIGARPRSPFAGPAHRRHAFARLQDVVEELGHGAWLAPSSHGPALRRTLTARPRVPGGDEGRRPTRTPT